MRNFPPVILMMAILLVGAPAWAHQCGDCTVVRWGQSQAVKTAEDARTYCRTRGGTVRVCSGSTCERLRPTHCPVPAGFTDQK
ncbi:MAG: hypothetical protein EBR79_02690 [Proteobacteria bacterium]|nr:hypothetical protein [Pseudomonadota bacterium]NBX86742.1 hypothetical protein [Pseudomonadota bacterium]